MFSTGGRGHTTGFRRDLGKFPGQPVLIRKGRCGKQPAE